MLLLLGCFEYRLDPAMIDLYGQETGLYVELIPAGTFTMGCSSEQENDCNSDENPTHQVTLSRDFYMMESEVTQTLYELVMGLNPSSFQGINLPVEDVSWYDVVLFANKLSELEGLDNCYTINGDNVAWLNTDCSGWRLPTEAEWEYAARGGQDFKYAGSNSASDVAWYDLNSSETHEVCSKNRNGYGLCDMSGNVWEWVWDRAGAYGSYLTVNPVGPTIGSRRVARGGGWYYGEEQGLRVSSRSSYSPSTRSNFLGFRLVRYS